MNFILTYTLCLGAFLLVLNDPARAQEAVPEQPPIACFFPVDTYGKIAPADEKARLDNISIQLLRDRELVTYISVYAGQRPCAGETQARIAFVKNHLVNTRGVEAERVILRDGGYREELSVEIWLWPRTGEFAPPPVSPNVDPSEVRVRDCKPISRRAGGRRNLRKG